jgi:hypothetical protein
VDDNDLSGLVAVRMRILFGRAAVCGPPRVADTVGAVKRLEPDAFFKVPKFAFGPPERKPIMYIDYCNSGLNKAAIFKL